ncbi:YsnF/AvaK domain-containing protein [Variovorax sp. J22P271]|uniref:YsnF/AvaK domain-containing protein n=1 Tax=Variovorax davisae TaxID=3053515 RepID=UPI0025769EE1|nr:YsnF/AvaK domain-containing protein [Variovorax sp. J22P271]MDM0032213.1 YsnF/AvaK domain-containing protein [Variovorax sp. J22P271]
MNPAKPILGIPESTFLTAHDGVRRLPVIEEELEVTKERVQRGGVRVTKRVETREQLVDELLRSEHVEVERRPVNVPLPDDAIPGIRQEGDTLILPVIEEVLVTVKRLVLVEEVRITRTQQTHRDPQTFSLRKEHIEVEHLSVEGPGKDSS